MGRKGFTLIELLIVVAIIGIIAAIAIPSLLRARVSANEAQVIGDTRTVISASVVYASNNCGFYAASLECMADQNSICIPNYPTNAPVFLGFDIGRASPYLKGGYVRNYIGRAASDPGSLCDPGSNFDFCYMSTPSNPGLTGVRSYSGTPAGTIYFDQAGAPIACPVPSGILSLE